MAYVYYNDEDLSIQVLTMHDHLEEPWPFFEYPDDEILPFLIGEKHANKYYIKMTDAGPVIELKPVEVVYANIDYAMYRVLNEDAPVMVIRNKNTVTISLTGGRVPTVRRYPNMYFTSLYNAHQLYYTYTLDLVELNEKKELTVNIPDIPRASLYINRFVDMSYEEI